jgi:hypothetical protein
MTSAMPLRGRVVLLTGASRRIAIGAGVARRLVADAPQCCCTRGPRMMWSGPGVPTPVARRSWSSSSAIRAD